MTSEASKNPDTRPLPANWVERFDPDQGSWYYLNISANPPIRSNLHPLGPLPPSGSFAQQLYASAATARVSSSSTSTSRSRTALNIPPPPSLLSAVNDQNSSTSAALAQRSATIYRTQHERYQELAGQRASDIKSTPNPEGSEDSTQQPSYISPPSEDPSLSSAPPPFEDISGQQGAELSRRPTMLPVYSPTAEEGLSAIDHDETSSLVERLETMSVALERQEFVGRGFIDNTSEASFESSSPPLPPDFRSSTVPPPPTFDDTASFRTSYSARVGDTSSGSGLGSARRPLPSISGVTLATANPLTSLDPSGQPVSPPEQTPSLIQRVSGPRQTRSPSTSSSTSSYALVNSNTLSSSPSIGGSNSPGAPSPQNRSPVPTVRDSNAYAQALYASALNATIPRSPASSTSTPSLNNLTESRSSSNTIYSPVSQASRIMTIAGPTGGSVTITQSPIIGNDMSSTNVTSNGTGMRNITNVPPLPHRRSVSGSPISVQSTGSTSPTFVRNSLQSQVQNQGLYQAEAQGQVYNVQSPVQLTSASGQVPQQQRTPYRYSEALVNPTFSSSSSSSSSKMKKISFWGVSNEEKKREKRLESERLARERAAAAREREKAIAEGSIRYIAPAPSIGQIGQAAQASGLGVIQQQGVGSIPGIQGNVVVSSATQPQFIQAQSQITQQVLQQQVNLSQVTPPLSLSNVSGQAQQQQSQVQNDNRGIGDVLSAANLGARLATGALNGASQLILGTRLTGTAHRPSVLGTAVSGLVSSIGNSTNISGGTTAAVVGGAIAGIAGAALLNEVVGDNGSGIDPSSITAGLSAVSDSVDIGNLTSGMDLSSITSGLDFGTTMDVSTGIDLSSFTSGFDQNINTDSSFDFGGLLSQSTTDLSAFDPNALTGIDTTIYDNTGYDPGVVMDNGDTISNIPSFDSFGSFGNTDNATLVDPSAYQGSFDTGAGTNDPYSYNIFPTDSPLDQNMDTGTYGTGETYSPTAQVPDVSNNAGDSTDPSGAGTDSFYQQGYGTTDWSDQLAEIQQQQQEASQQQQDMIQDQMEHMQHEIEQQHKLEEHAIHEQQQQIAHLQQASQQQTRIHQQQIQRLQHQIMQYQAQQTQLQSQLQLQAANQTRIQQQFQTYMKVQQQANARIQAQVQAQIVAQNQRLEQQFLSHISSAQGQTSAQQAHTSRIFLQNLKRMQQAHLQAINAILLRPNHLGGSPSGQGTSVTGNANHGQPGSNTSLGPGPSSGIGNTNVGSGANAAPPVPSKPNNAHRPPAASGTTQNPLTAVHHHPVNLIRPNAPVRPTHQQNTIPTNTTGAHQAQHQSPAVVGNSGVNHARPPQHQPLRLQSHIAPQQHQAPTHHNTTHHTGQGGHHNVPQHQQQHIAPNNSGTHMQGNTAHNQSRPPQINQHQQLSQVHATVHATPSGTHQGASHHTPHPQNPLKRDATQ